jgi:hypothetical protein
MAVAKYMRLIRNDIADGCAIMSTTIVAAQRDKTKN